MTFNFFLINLNFKKTCFENIYDSWARSPWKIFKKFTKVYLKKNTVLEKMFLKKYFLTNLGLLSNKSLKNILLDSWFMKTLKLLLKKVLKQKALRNIFKIILDSLSLNIYKKIHCISDKNPWKIFFNFSKNT